MRQNDAKPICLLKSLYSQYPLDYSIFLIRIIIQTRYGMHKGKNNFSTQPAPFPLKILKGLKSTSRHV